MAVTKITALPTPPQTTDAVNFDARADKFVAAIPNFATECNTLAAELESLADQNDKNFAATQELLTNSKGEITTAKNEAISAISTAQTSGVNAIKSQQTTSANAINTAKNTAVSAVSTQQTSSVKAVTDAQAAATTAITNAQNTGVTAVKNQQTASATAITNAQNTATKAVQTQQATSVNAVKSAQSTATSAISAAQTAGVEAVKASAAGFTPLTQNLSWTVGTGGTYTTLISAIDAASRYSNSTKGGESFNITITLLSGYVWNESIVLKNVDLSYITITSSATISAKLSALSPYTLHGAKYTSLLCLDNAKLSIDTLNLSVTAETSLGNATSGTIELIKLCDNSTLYAKNFTLDSSKISAATNDYKALYMLTNSVFFGTSLSLTFDNTLKTSQPSVWIKDKSSVSFGSITINGSEPNALVKEKNYRLYGVIVTNQSIFYSSNTITIKALNYGIRLEYSTIGFEIYKHSNALVSIAANVSTIARGNMTITQNLTADTNATQTALELTNSTLKAINITFSGIGFISSSDSEIDIFGFVNLTSTQPQANVKNTWKCEIKGGSCNINTLKYTPQKAGTNDFISYPKLTAASEYSGLVNAGDGVNFKVLFVDISNITLQWLKVGTETQAANPKGLFSFGGGRFQISKASKLANYAGKYITAAGVASNYSLKLYAAAAMPNMLSQLALGDFSVLSANHSNLDEANPVTQLATGTLALIAKGKPPAPTLSFNSAGSGVTSGEMNFGFWRCSNTNINVATILGYQSNRASKSIVIYSNLDLTGYSVSVEKGGIFKAKYHHYYHDYGYDYDYDYDYEFAAKIEGNKITLTIYGANKAGYFSGSIKNGWGEDYFTSCITCVLNSTIKVIDAAGNQSNAITLKVGSW